MFSSTLECEEDILELLAVVRVTPGALFVLRLPGAATRLVQQLEDIGARLCDVLVTLSRSVDSGNETAPRMSNFTIRTATELDAPALRSIGASAFTGFSGHWHADPRLPSDRCDELYARWAASLATSATDNRMTFVAEKSPGNIVGFLSLKSDAARTWHVPLAGVDPAYQRAGALQSMLNDAMTSIGELGGGEFCYETQLNNAAAIRAVTRCGFVLTNSRLTLHLWTPAE